MSFNKLLGYLLSQRDSEVDYLSELVEETVSFNEEQFALLPNTFRIARARANNTTVEASTSPIPSDENGCECCHGGSTAVAGGEVTLCLRCAADESDSLLVSDESPCQCLFCKDEGFDAAKDAIVSAHVTDFIVMDHASVTE
jgi:hypothetical protein